MRKKLRGETEFMPTGQLIEKGPNALAKRKHQISYLAMRAQVNEQELEAMWSSNRQTKRESKSKYGF
jgi:proline-rich protein PRCC